MIDWSKSHNGVMLCTFEQTIELMPEVESILSDLYPLLELPKDDYRVDVKVHMLMPNQYPCIPNWHQDFRARDDKGNRVKSDCSPLKMYMWISGAPLTEYKDKEGNSYFKEPGKWSSFTQEDVHRGTMSTEHTWRCFIRVIPSEFIHKNTKNIGQLRRHTQVYLDANKFRW